MVLHFFGQNRKSATLLGFLLLLLALTLAQLANQLNQKAWIYSEWLINFASGPIRRGLSGELVLLAAPWISPPVTIFLIAGACYIILYYALYRLAAPLVGRPEIAISLLSPLGLLFPIYDSRAAGRKDIVPLAIVAVALLLARRGSLVMAQLVFVTLSFASFMFVWEGSFFFSGFALAVPLLTALHARGWKVAVAQTGVAFLTITAAFIAVATLLPSSVQQSDILVMCERLGAYAPVACTTEYGIGWLTHRLPDVMKETIQRAADGGVSVYFVAACLGFLPLTLLWRVYSPRGTGRNFAQSVYCILLAAVALTLPIYTQIDWGRWFSMTYLFLLLLLLFAIRIGWVHRAADGEPNWGMLFGQIEHGRAWLPIAAAAALLYSLSWNAPVCCRTALGKGMLGVIESALEKVHARLDR
jgi:hypothetical protein